MQELEDDINISVINPQEAQWALGVRGTQTQQTEINTALAHQGGEEMQWEHRSETIKQSKIQSKLPET